MRRAPCLKGSRPSVKCKESVKTISCNRALRRGTGRSTQVIHIGLFPKFLEDAEITHRRRPAEFSRPPGQKPLLITWQQSGASVAQLPISLIFSSDRIDQSFKASGSVVITRSEARAPSSSLGRGTLILSALQVRINQRITSLCPSYSQAPCTTDFPLGFSCNFGEAIAFDRGKPIP